MRKTRLLLCFFAAFAAAPVFLACNEVGYYGDACGDGELSGDEICDGALFKEGFAKCSAYNSQITWVSGAPGCSSKCQLSLGSCEASDVVTCGNDEVDAGEDCDGAVFGEGKSVCTALDANKQWRDGGAPGCALCKLTKGSCEEENATGICGNNHLDTDEACDGTLFVDDNKACTVFDATRNWIPGGEIACENCTVVKGSCEEESSTQICGNENLESGEACDGTLFVDDNKACTVLDATRTWKPGGEIACENCAVVKGSCEEETATQTCGNKHLETGEACDGTLFLNDNKACTVFDATRNWLPGGEIACENCTVVQGSCEEDLQPMTCGNGQLEDGEKCDSAQLIRGASACVALSDVVGTAYYGTSGLSIFWAGSPSCDACAKLGTGTCAQSSLQTTTIKQYLTKTPSDTTTLNETGVSVAGLGSVKWNLSNTQGSWAFANWAKSTTPDLPNPNVYIDLSAGDVSSYEHVSISFNFKRDSSKSVNSLAVTVYDASTYKSTALDLRSVGFSGWNSSGNIVVPAQGMKDLHFRINAYDAGSYVGIKDVVITGLK